MLIISEPRDREAGKIQFGNRGLCAKNPVSVDIQICLISYRTFGNEKLKSSNRNAVWNLYPKSFLVDLYTF